MAIEADERELKPGGVQINRRTVLAGAIGLGAGAAVGFAAGRADHSLLSRLAGSTAAEITPVVPEGYQLTFQYLPAIHGLSIRDGGPADDGYRDGSGIFTPRLWYDETPQGFAMPFNGEYGFYADPAYAWPGGWSPFSVEGEVLKISAMRASRMEGFKDHLPNRFVQDHDTGKPYPFITGLLATRHSFMQRGGIWRIRAHLPAGRSLSPVLWTMPPGRQLGEINIAEYVPDQGVSRFYANVHGGDAEGEFIETRADLSQNVHDYELEWVGERLFFRRDGALYKDVDIRDNPYFQDQRPQYLLISLAVGGDNPGWILPPNEDTPDIAELRISRIQVLQRRGPHGLFVSRDSFPIGARAGDELAVLSAQQFGSQSELRYSLEPGHDNSLQLSGNILLAGESLKEGISTADLRVTDEMGNFWTRRLTYEFTNEADNLFSFASALHSYVWDKAHMSVAEPQDHIFEEGDSYSEHGVYRTLETILNAGIRYRLGLQIRSADRRWLRLRTYAEGYTSAVDHWFDLQTAQVGKTQTYGDAFEHSGAECRSIAGVVDCRIDFVPRNDIQNPQFWFNMSPVEGDTIYQGQASSQVAFRRAYLTTV